MIPIIYNKILVMKYLKKETITQNKSERLILMTEGFVGALILFSILKLALTSANTVFLYNF